MFVYVTLGHKATRHFDFSKEYYLMLAWGPIYDGNKHIFYKIFTKAYTCNMTKDLQL